MEHNTVPPFTIVRPGEGRHVPIPGFGADFKLDSHTTGGAVSLVEHPFAIAALAVAMLGAGRISLEQLLFGRPVLTGWAGLAVASGLGLTGGAGQLVPFYRPMRAPAVTA